MITNFHSFILEWIQKFSNFWENFLALFWFLNSTDIGWILIPLYLLLDKMKKKKKKSLVGIFEIIFIYYFVFLTILFPYRHIFNFDFPRNIEEYVHRIGRTGRAGKSGESISLVTRKDWGSAAELIKILEEANQVQQ